MKDAGSTLAPSFSLEAWLYPPLHAQRGPGGRGGHRQLTDYSLYPKRGQLQPWGQA